MMKKENKRYQESYVEETLDNGLHVVLWQKPDYAKSLFMMATPLGALDLKQKDEEGKEYDFPAGIAHFLDVYKRQISTDIIVGFPNETKEQFQHTLDLVDECKFDNAFTFIYSPREGTPAARMEDNIPLEEKQERLQQLNERWNRYALEKNLAYIEMCIRDRWKTSVNY